MRRMLRGVLSALGLWSLGFAACGKEENLHPPSVLEFPNSMPEAPRPLASSGLPAWTSGHGLAATDAFLFVVDRDNGALVRMDRATLAIDKTLPVGARPEQVVVGPDGSAFVTVRGAGEVVRVGPDFTVAARVAVGLEPFGIALAIDAKTAYVTMSTAAEVVALDTTTLAELDRIRTLDVPRGIAVSPNKWLAVVHQQADVANIPLDDQGLMLNELALPAVLRQASPADHMTGARIHALTSTRALAAAVSPETGGVFVAHVMAAPGNEADFLAGATMVVNTGPDGAPMPPSEADMVPANGSPAGSSGGVPSDGGYGSTSSVGATFNIPTRPVELGVTATDGLGAPLAEDVDFPVQDRLTGEPLTHLIDQPSDIVHHPSWSLLFVTGYGTDNVLAFSTASGDPLRSPVAVMGAGRAPRAIAIAPDGMTAYVLNDHALTVSAIDLSPLFALPIATHSTEFPVTTEVHTTTPAQGVDFEAAGMAMPMPSESDGSHAIAFPNPSSTRVHPARLTATREAAFGKDPLPAAVRRGARVFTFARNTRISHAGQFACASCHFEGTEDKLTWFVPEGPRQTPALAGRLAGTAPFNWGGTKAQLKSNMVQTVERMGGDGLTKAELADLEQFLLHGLTAPANPNVAPDGRLDARQEQGKALFNDPEVGCASCHRPSEHFTDGEAHDVGTGSALESVIFQQHLAQDPEAKPPWRLNTPTLKGLFYTAPYLHDGSARDLETVLARTAETMGHTADLTADQKSALIAYLETL